MSLENKNNMNAKIRIFSAPTDKETCTRYIQGHRSVLESYGVTKVTSAFSDWVDDPYTYVIVIESVDGERILGGGRIQIKSESRSMPMEHAIARIDPKIFSYMRRFEGKKVAEFCGLFNSKEVAGYGFGSIFLGRVGVAVCTLLELDHLLALCSPATLRNCMRVGFEVIRDLGNNGTFYYPKEDLIATALIIHNINQLPTADSEDQERILFLRENPVTKSIEKGPKGEMEIMYDLSISK